MHPRRRLGGTSSGDREDEKASVTEKVGGLPLAMSLLSLQLILRRAEGRTCDEARAARRLPETVGDRFTPGFMYVTR